MSETDFFVYTDLLGHLQKNNNIRPNKKIISVLRVMGLKFLDRLGKHFFSGNEYDFMHFERHFAFQNA